jgi:ribosomal protein S18 acetylase RimI-like enzyme
MSHPLDNPVWSALSGPHFRLGASNGTVRHYDPTIAIFAGVEDPFASDFAGLPKARSYGFVTTGPVTWPASLEATRQVEVLQMIAEAPKPATTGGDLMALGEVNVPEMMALVELTQPGPFARRTLKMGKFWGIVEDGRLAAMAGERMRLTGFTEVSAVCTHPDYRGQGYALELVSKVLGGIMERSETPFLHVYPNNAGAIGLYERLGFAPRRVMTFTVVRPR